MKYIGYIFLFVKRGWQRLLWGNIQKSMMAECGDNVKLANGCDLSYSNLHIKNNVYLGPFTYVISPVAQVFIGNNVMFGPNVMIISGNHRTDLIGEYMINVKESELDNDKDIKIEDDVWVGANVIILKGVTIGRGSVIGAGSIVTKDLDPYSICVGIGGQQKIRKRFNEETISEHEKILKKTV